MLLIARRCFFVYNWNKLEIETWINILDCLCDSLHVLYMCCAILNVQSGSSRIIIGIALIVEYRALCWMHHVGCSAKAP